MEVDTLDTLGDHGMRRNELKYHNDIVALISNSLKWGWPVRCDFLGNNVGDFHKSQPPLLLTKLGLHQRRFGDSGPPTCKDEFQGEDVYDWYNMISSSVHVCTHIHMHTDAVRAYTYTYYYVFINQCTVDIPVSVDKCRYKSNINIQCTYNPTDYMRTSTNKTPSYCSCRSTKRCRASILDAWNSVLTWILKAFSECWKPCKVRLPYLDCITCFF